MTVGHLAQPVYISHVYPERQPPFTRRRRPVFALPVLRVDAAAFGAGHDRHGARRQSQHAPLSRVARVTPVGDGPKGGMADTAKFAL